MTLATCYFKIGIMAAYAIIREIAFISLALNEVNPSSLRPFYCKKMKIQRIDKIRRGRQIWIK